MPVGRPASRGGWPQAHGTDDPGAPPRRVTQHPGRRLGLASYDTAYDWVAAALSCGSRSTLAHIDAIAHDVGIEVRVVAVLPHEFVGKALAVLVPTLGIAYLVFGIFLGVAAIFAQPSAASAVFEGTHRLITGTRS
jgi:hypothetical protein